MGHFRNPIALVLLNIAAAEAIKFKRGDNFLPDGETTIVTGDSTSLTCDYIKWKNERLYSITWSLQYLGLRSGQKTEFFVWHQDGKKESQSNPILEVEEAASGDKTVSVQMTQEMQGEELAFCCEVKVIKDEGYGSMKPLKKMKCSETIKVTEGVATVPSLLVSSSHPIALVGDVVEIQCSPEEPNITPLPSHVSLGLSVNGNKLYASMNDQVLIGRFKVTQNHFQANNVFDGSFDSQTTPSGKLIHIDCIGRHGQKIVAESSMIIRENISPSVSRHSSGSFSTTGHSRGARNNFQGESLQKPGVTAISYLLVQEEFGREATTIRGAIPTSIKQQLARTTQTALDVLEVQNDAVSVLNTLGYNGYQVVGMTKSPANSMVWTMERKYFGSHQNEL